MNRKVLIAATLMLVIGFASGAAYAGEPALGQAYDLAMVSPMWSGMDDYEADLSVRSGKATCSVLVELGSSSADKVGFSIKLQQYQSGGWKTIDSWTQKVSPTSGKAKFKESVSISKGFTYRFTGKIKTYKKGKQYEKNS